MSETELQKAIKTVESAAWTQRYASIKTVVDAAKQLSVVQAENEKLKTENLYALDAAEKGAKGRELGTAYEEFKKELESLTKENARMRGALNKIGFYCAGESTIGSGALEAITNLTLTAQGLDPAPPLSTQPTTAEKKDVV